MERNANLAKEIVFSRVIKAGKRIYYVDVKRSRNSEMYLSLTESKKVVNGDPDDGQVSFEKHKIFIYREDFDKVKEGLCDAINYIEERQGKADPRAEESNNDIKLDIEF